MELLVIPLQTMRQAKRKDQVLWTSDNTNGYYTTPDASICICLRKAWFNSFLRACFS